MAWFPYARAIWASRDQRLQQLGGEVRSHCRNCTVTGSESQQQSQAGGLAGQDGLCLCPGPSSALAPPGTSIIAQRPKNKKQSKSVGGGAKTAASKTPSPYPGQQKGTEVTLGAPEEIVGASRQVEYCS